MAFTPDPPYPKSQGNPIRSKDWNDVVEETKRLDTDKVNLSGGAMTGPLSVTGTLGINTASAPKGTLEVDSGNNNEAAILGLSTPSGDDFLAFSGGKSSNQNPLIAWKRGDLRIGRAASFGGQAFSEKLRIAEDGNVGIGVTDPKDRLDINGAIRFAGQASRRILGEARGGHHAIVAKGHWDELEIKGRMIDWTGNNLHIGYANDHSAHYIEIGRKVGFTRFLSGGGLAETMRITNDKVGINTSEPSTDLHVNGEALVGNFALGRGGIGALHVSGGKCGIIIGRRGLTSWPSSPQKGDRYWLYNPSGNLRIWTEQTGTLLEVTSDGHLFGAARDANYRLKIFTGSTSRTNTNWVQYGSNGIYVDVNTSAAGFATSTTPLYFTTLGGDTRHWKMSGVTSIYSPDHNSFRVFIHQTGITVATAKARKCHVNWVGIGR